MVIAINMLQAQEITLSKNEKKFQKDGTEYKLSAYKTEFANPIAKNYIREGRSHKSISTVLGFLGGLMIGAGLPNALSKQQYTYNYNNYQRTKVSKPGWAMVAGGGVLVATAIPLAYLGKKKIRNGVKTENKFGMNSQTYYQFQTDGNTLGVTVNF